MAQSQAPGKKLSGVLPDHPALKDIDPSTQFLYTPHTLTALCIGVLAIMYYSQALNPPATPETTDQMYANAKHGIWAAILVYLGYSVIQGPATPMTRPHPTVWRLVHGMMVVYLVWLVFMLFLDVNQARQFMKHFYPELGVEPHERMYGTDCRLYLPGEGINWPVIRDTVFDEFVIAHTLGWWGKALILRNYPVLWVLSITFEFMEQTFQHMLPNFNECWWDSWVLDVLGCNLIGMVSGVWTVRWFGSRTYDWSGLSKQPTLYAKAKRGLLQFTPHTWDNFDWRMFESPARCLEAFILIAVILLFEVNAFFLKYLLWIPPRNLLNSFRLLLLFLIALPSVKEYYIFVETRERNVFTKLGTFAWLGVAIALAETLLCIKFGHGLFPAPWPRKVLLLWGSALGTGALFLAVWSVRYYGLLGRKQKRA